jgi:hypothetical protein
LSIPALFTIAFADGLWHVGQALLIVALWELAEDLGLAVVFQDLCQHFDLDSTSLWS